MDAPSLGTFKTGLDRALDLVVGTLCMPSWGLELDDHEVLLQPKPFCDSMILYVGLMM